jgi:hypothetical protein
LFTRWITKNPSKTTIAIAAYGIGVLLAASSAATTTWSSGTPTRASTTADYVSTAGNGATPGNTPGVPAQSQDANSQPAWQAQSNAVAQVRLAAARAAAIQAATSRAAAARAAAARRATLRRAAHRHSAHSQARALARLAAQPSGSPRRIAMSMMTRFGWSASQFGCLDPLWSEESGWSVTAENGDGAYGIPQAMPGGKMSSAGPDWQTNATTQIRWGLRYIKRLYGSPCGAWSHEEATGWY